MTVAIGQNPGAGLVTLTRRYHRETRHLRLKRGTRPTMRIGAIHGPDGKVFRTVAGEKFNALLKGGLAIRDLREVIALLGEGGALEYGSPIDFGTAKIAAPVGPLARNVVCVGKNYHEHA